MRVLVYKEVIINLIVFFMFSFFITYISNKVPDKIYSWKNRIFRERKWEISGQVYQKLFKVKQWKKVLPELNDFVKSVFPKKQIKEFNEGYLYQYLTESCKAELTHWCIIFSALLFLFWEDTGTSVIMLVFAAVINIPFIIIQRYNRPRILKMINYMDKH